MAKLSAVACRFPEAPDFYLSLRYRAATLRLIAYDSHPRHTNPLPGHGMRGAPQIRPQGPVLRVPGLRRRLGLRRVEGAGRRNPHVGDAAEGVQPLTGRER
ncbi:hypothetical protein GCM10018783_37510 [Streptomyces griseosporeus]|nr:hypothetical protein GCM10018783_37510 [Streptomyces griseosporeus]